MKPEDSSNQSRSNGLLRLASERIWLCLAAICIILTGTAFGTILTHHTQVDFVAFWNASKLILAGNPLGVYDVQPSDIGVLMPLAYPPPYLVVLAPLASISLGPSFVIWVAVTGLSYLVACRAPKGIALGNPAAASNAMVGQNGFVTSAILLFGLQALERNAAMAGAVLGLMVIKPHLALLVPVAIVAARQWVALLAAAASASAMILVASGLFGIQSYFAFWDRAHFFQSLLLSGRWPWDELASTFALARWTGMEEASAWVLQLGIAAFGAISVWIAWSANSRGKIAIFAAATLLVSPYLFTYDAVLLVAALAWINARRPAWGVGIAILCAMPLLKSFGLYSGPNTISVAALLSLVCTIYLTNRERTDGERSMPWGTSARE